MRTFWIAILLALLIPTPDSPGEVIRKKKPYAWEPAGSVKVLYETPIGKVYQIEASGFFNRETRRGASLAVRWNQPLLNRKNNDDGLHTLNLVLYDNNRERETRKGRYVVIEFSLRAFPVQKRKKEIEGVRNNGLASLFLLASSQYENITSLGAVRFRFPDLDGVTCPRDSGNLRIDPGMLYRKEKKFAATYLDAGMVPCCFPMYSLTPCRIIMERESLKLVALNFAGIRKIVVPDSDLNFKKSPIVTLALGCAEDSVLEVASPTVRFLEEEQLKALDSLGMRPYPYELYQDDRKSRRRWGSNPDFEYARAMKQLYSRQEQDWENGFRELRKLANKDHALALFQTGCAYWRGIGCEVDLEKAESCFKDAADLEVPGALVMRKALLRKKYLKTGKNEWINPSGNAVRILKKERIEERVDSYEPPLLPDEIRITGNPKVEFLALLPKLYRKNCDGQVLRILEDLCAENFTPAFYLRANGPGVSPDQIQKLYEKGAALGDPFCTLELIRIKMQSSSFQPSMISVNELWNARKLPWIHALLYGIRNPGCRFLPEILKADMDRLKNLDPATPEEHFLSGIAFLHDFLYGQERIGSFRYFSRTRSLFFADSMKNELSLTMKNRIQKALSSLEFAAEKGIPEAQAFVADPEPMEKAFVFNPFQSLKHLENAAPRNLFAAIKAADYFLSRNNPEKALHFIQRIPDQNAGIALELHARVLQLKHPNAPETIRAWNKAGSAGSLLAMRFLGNLEYEKKNFAKAAAYRSVFLQTDARRRNQDLNEITWGPYFTKYEFPAISGQLPVRLFAGKLNQKEIQRLLALVP